MHRTVHVYLYVYVLAAVTTVGTTRVRQAFECLGWQMYYFCYCCHCMSEKDWRCSKRGTQAT